MYRLKIKYFIKKFIYLSCGFIGYIAWGISIACSLEIIFGLLLLPFGIYHLIQNPVSGHDAELFTTEFIKGFISGFIQGQ